MVNKAIAKLGVGGAPAGVVSKTWAAFAAATNTFSINMRVVAGDSQTFSPPVYTDPILGITVYIKFILVVVGNVQELGLRLSVDVCLKIPGKAGMYCGAHLPKCDPLPGITEIATGNVGQKDALCIATLGLVNFHSMLYKPPYKIADVDGLGFVSFCDRRRRRLGDGSDEFETALLLEAPGRSLAEEEAEEAEEHARLRQLLRQLPASASAHPVRFYEYGMESENVRQRERAAAKASLRRVLQATNDTLGTTKPLPLAFGFAGNVLIGSAESGFNADITGQVNAAKGSAEFTINHQGGWAPIAAFSEYLATPAFQGHVAMNVEGVPLFVNASVAYTRPISMLNGEQQSWPGTGKRRTATLL